MDEKTKTRLMFENRLRALEGKEATIQLVRDGVPMSFRGVVETPNELTAGTEPLIEWSVFVERRKDEKAVGYNAMGQPVTEDEVRPQMRMYFSALEVFGISEHLETEDEAAKELGVSADGSSRIARPPAGMALSDLGHGR